MTEREYSEQLKRVKEYTRLKEIIEQLKFDQKSLENGILRISAICGYGESEPSELKHGDGFPEMIKTKICEAYQEQIDKIKAEMEEI